MLATVAAGTLALTGGVAVSAQSSGNVEPLVLTPSQQEGPFYPVELPADRDSDLTVVEGSAGPAGGETLLLDGSLVTLDGEPVEGAVVEIWQTDDLGVYLHPQDPGFADRDEAFQGYGESVTDASGAWSFRTILPELYGGRPRHIHAKVKVEGETALTTQIYFSGGDIPETGTVAVTDALTDALTIEAVSDVDANGKPVLRAEHIIVIP
jgi:protocatechuate 3,4-dioxygenase beta subunit